MGIQIAAALKLCAEFQHHPPMQKGIRAAQSRESFFFAQNVCKEALERQYQGFAQSWRWAFFEASTESRLIGDRMLMAKTAEGMCNSNEAFVCWRIGSG